jgi:hypothetical protein
MKHINLCEFLINVMKWKHDTERVKELISVIVKWISLAFDAGNLRRQFYFGPTGWV